MGYKWKPNATQKREYAERMRQQESMSFVGSSGAIRKGCKVSWIDKSTGDEFRGVVINSSYGAIKNQHTFTIELDNGDTKLVKGRNLYDRLLSHIQGEISKDKELNQISLTNA